MPPINLSKPLGWANFMSKEHKSPPEDDFKKERERLAKDSTVSEQYREGIGEGNYGKSTAYMPFFTPQEPHTYHAMASTTNSIEYHTLHDLIIDAFAYAHNIWRTQAYFTGLTVNGPVVVGSAGCLKGPDIEEWMNRYPGKAEKSGQNFEAWFKAASKGIGDCHQKYVDGVTVPSLPWYPAFSAYPLAVAPPMPNTPMPFVSCTSIHQEKMFHFDSIKKAILSEMGSLRKELKDKVDETMCESVAKVISTGYMSWASTQQVINAMGSGSVPTFAPPAVPAGPVVNGSVLSSPGILSV